MEKPRTRKHLGSRIKAARRAAGYKSARSFAAAVGVSESSIANAERGSTSVGMGVYLDIETKLGWPHGSIERYLTSGDPVDLPSAEDSRPNIGALKPRDEFEAKVLASRADPDTKAHYIRKHRAAIAEEERLLRLLEQDHPKVAEGEEEFRNGA